MRWRDLLPSSSCATLSKPSLGYLVPTKAQRLAAVSAHSRRTVCLLAMRTRCAVWCRWLPRAERLQAVLQAEICFLCLLPSRSPHLLHCCLSKDGNRLPRNSFPHASQSQSDFPVLASSRPLSLHSYIFAQTGTGGSGLKMPSSSRRKRATLFASPWTVLSFRI